MIGRLRRSSPDRQAGRGDELDRPDERDRRIRELEERLSRLSEASVSINESLEFETVLQRVLDSAPGLTGARYGVIAAMDEQGGLEAVADLGHQRGRARAAGRLPGGTRIFAHFMATADPLRVDD